MNNKTIKIGIDLHGVISDLPDFFSFFTNTMVNAGAEVHILSGGFTERDLKLLADKNIKYTHLFSIVEYHQSIGTPTYGKHPKFGFDMISDDAWDRTKGNYCKEQGIDFHIDDTLAYNTFFETPFCRFWSHSNSPKPEHKDKRHID